MKGGGTVRRGFSPSIRKKDSDNDTKTTEVGTRDSDPPLRDNKYGVRIESI